MSSVLVDLLRFEPATEPPSRMWSEHVTASSRFGYFRKETGIGMADEIPSINIRSRYDSVR